MNKPAWKQPEYYAYAVLCDGCVKNRHLTLYKAQKVANTYKSNLFECYEKIEILHEFTGEIYQF